MNWIVKFFTIPNQELRLDQTKPTHTVKERSMVASVSLSNRNHVLPDIAGQESRITSIVQHNQPVFLPTTDIKLES